MTELPLVVFETTSRCNLDCAYCYNHWKGPGFEVEPFGGYGEAKRTLGRLFEVARVGRITMSGGEPLLAERFAELVLFCRMKGKSVSVITNGNQGSPEALDQLQALGVDLFELPIHSATAGPHDAMTGTPGSWARSVDSVRHLLSRGAPVTVALVVTRQNHREVPETLRFLAGLGVERVMLNRFNIGGRGILERDRLWLSPAEVVRVFEAADAAMQGLPLRLSSNVATPYCLVDPRRFRRIAFSGCSAELARLPVTLDARGDLRSCNHSPVVLGNIHRQSLEEILRSEHLRVRAETVPEPCRECRDFARCFGGCRAAAEQLGCGPEAADPLLSCRPTSADRGSASGRRP